ncbi:MAG: ABC-2 type transport system ATP-binding protein [Chlamydiales bacterium]|jgi:ABC-2 type transport system ATP-binding protein
MSEPSDTHGACGPAALVVRGFGKTYADHVAVQDLSFEARAGEILGLVGPNGAGKTTTLRSIAGILPIQNGRIVLAGYDVAVQEEQAKSELGWVPDDPQPFDALTVMEHMEFTARLYGVDDWRDRADELLERFDLAAKHDALGGELSRGMRQKLAIACAWLSNPSVVLLDEPLAGLDPRGIRTARSAIRMLADEGVAVILSTHLLELIEAMADRILIMDKGRKLFEGTLVEARERIASGPGSSLEELFLAATEGVQGEDEAPAEPDRQGA